jgi:hypothetical protein
MLVLARRARRRRQQRPRPGPVAALAGLALLVAACGGPHQTAPGAGSGQNLSQRLDAYASCVRGHGVPDFYITRAGTAPPSPGTVQEVFHGWLVPVNPSQAAQKACQHLLPTHTLPTGAELRQQFLRSLKSAKCMRAHGYPHWPDPVMRNGLVPNFVPPGVDVNSPQFQATAKTCSL